MADPVVELKCGSVRGTIEKDEEGSDYYAFKGIPYAEPPIGKLRFKDPVPKERWTGIIDCKSYGPICLQYDMFMKTSSLNEDCLHLNVFTRSINDTDLNIPVMVVIHGGGFAFGNSSDFLFGPEYLMRKDIILVTFNYRLNILGFLDLEDEIASGNQGLKDIVLAFQWVQQNIRKFGGDPDNVTALGISTGAAAAQLIALSPLGKGLFQRIIAQGTTVYETWVFKNHSNKPNAIKLCSLLGKELQDTAEIFEFLQSAEPQMLVNGLERLHPILDHIAFGPVVDDKSSNPFMPNHPLQLANDGIHLPCLVGCNSHEGLLLLIGMSTKDYLQLCESNFQKIFMFYSDAILEHYNLTLTQFKRLYFKSKAVSEDTLAEYVTLVSDIYFVHGIHRFAKVQAQKSSAPTYLFQFSYNPTPSLSKAILKNAPDGCSHFDDLPFLFKMRIFEAVGVEYWKKGTKQYEMMEQMTEMLTNFAKYGRPTIDISQLTPVHWQPITDGTMLRYLNIDEDITMQHIVNIEEKWLSAKDIKHS